MKIRVKSLSLDSYGFATMMDDSGRVFVELDNGPSYWLPEADLQQVVYLCDCSPDYCCCNNADREFSPDVTEYIALRMNEELSIKDPKGILSMKNVRLVIGEGANKIEIGIAEIQLIPNGDAAILLTVTNPQIADMLGGNKIQGVIPRVVEPETPVEEEEPHE